MAEICVQKETLSFWGSREAPVSANNIRHGLLRELRQRAGESPLLPRQKNPPRVSPEASGFTDMSPLDAKRSPFWVSSLDLKLFQTLSLNPNVSWML